MRGACSKARARPWQAGRPVIEVHESLSSYGGRAEQIVEAFAGFDRYVAGEDHEPLLALQGRPPPGRFFLVAIPRGGIPRERPSANSRGAAR
jgi:hypothetical protein